MIIQHSTICRTDTVHYYSQILYLQICLFANICNPQINYGTFVVIWGHSQSGKNISVACACIPS